MVMEEENNTIDIAVSSSLNWVQAHIKLPGFNPDIHWNKEIEEICLQFLAKNNAAATKSTGSSKNHKTKLFMFMHDDTLIVSPNLATIPKGSLPSLKSCCGYFLRKNVPVGMKLDGYNLHKYVQWGVINGEVSSSLLNLMSGVYGPQMLGNKSWPEATRKEL